MNSLYSIIDLAQLGLAFERLSVRVAAQNVAGANTAGYISKQVDRASFLMALENGVSSGELDGSTHDTSNWLVEGRGSDVRLDEEVLNLSMSEMRYQALAGMVRAKFSLIDLAMGVKGK